MASFVLCHAGGHTVVPRPGCAAGLAEILDLHRHLVRWLHLCRYVRMRARLCGTRRLESVRMFGDFRHGQQARTGSVMPVFETNCALLVACGMVEGILHGLVSLCLCGGSEAAMSSLSDSIRRGFALFAL